ncbi:helix-turn-helix transcriptional regulator [Burkholderia pseudomallei]|uniref:helix-turn-helix transcriptional regulator n=1 Tax=Burkholderia pseudomallei TaxID=28450 RepID=UPI0009765F50|nr:helix-turn-helix domain-containing protein [Burkholderia pseudomallei]
MEPKLLTPKALAEMLGLAEQTIYNRHSKGGDLPPSIKIGRLLRFPTVGVDAWLASKSSSSGQPPPSAAAPAANRRGRPTKAEQVAARQFR